MMNTILATKSKSKKGLLVHQQMWCIASHRATRSNCGKLSWQRFRPLLCVNHHTQVVTTAQEPKGLSCSTKGKLVGKVRRLQIETIRSQVLTCQKMTARMQFRDSMVVGREQRLKIESVPTEMWSSRGITPISCYWCEESLKGGPLGSRKACSPIPTKQIAWLSVILHCVLYRPSLFV